MQLITKLLQEQAVGLLGLASLVYVALLGLAITTLTIFSFLLSLLLTLRPTE